ncbi:putative beta-1,3-galactosyltransferase 20 [Dorcoceras hygrometricum]|uniref:Putative beta-1,3-galactosyltransferase 20 n=1 Tax=Dorcoceras hygrometricum TaxID=472368 RepID=A0A2Z7BBZ8_9LAMI|nr:putative beta-1,3-galactosyltransferase 20 [Dorcoceras hygrometricum]
MVKRLATSPHDPLGITDSACKNQSVVVSVLYGPFNPYIPIRSTTIGKSRVARDPIAMHTSWRSNSDIASVTSIGYPRISASGESSTTMHRLLHASGSHPIPTPGDPNRLHRSCSSWFILRLFLASVPAGPFAPSDLSSSAEDDVITDYIIIDGPLRCSSWFSFDVPADPYSSSSTCSWFLS